MGHVRRMAIVVLAAVASLALNRPITAQRGELEKKPFEDEQAGYRLKPPREWTVIPVPPDARAAGMAFQAAPADKKSPLNGCFRIVLVEDDSDLFQWLEEASFHTIRKHFSAKGANPELDETLKIGPAAASHRRWKYEGLFLDAWLIEHAPKKVGVIGTVDEADKYAKSWLSLYERSAKSFETVEVAAAPKGGGTTYAEKLAAAEAEAARTSGWRALPTPSKKFIMVTSCENQKFIDEVIERLERSREIYEADYPPPADFTHVSIVRLCAKEEEFHRYGGTGGGVAGWFNPSTTELVLYDAKAIDRNMSYAVMTHEGFHQYCHFLFGRSEAHRWFDEGLGDYYGGMKIDGQKARITAHMPSGLDRLPVIREMLQLDTAKPLVEHLNYDHASWQSQGPSNVSCYAQSWSIVYMLRQGMAGNVNSKVWKKEYAEILPAYITALNKGFQDAYREEREKRALAKSGGNPANQTTATIEELDSDDLGPAVVKRIWTDAMSASWGKIDLTQFEADWKLYVKKFLKD